MQSPRYRILVVEDEQQTRRLIIDLLSQKGHRCLGVENGREAFNRLMEGKFDALVTDIAMPEMDGISLTKEFSRHYQNLPIMVITGHTDEYSAEMAIGAGAREFIKKPFSVYEFLIRFDKMMSSYETEKALMALSLMDELTGLYNRRRFFVLAEQYMKVALRGKRRLLLLFIDMDNLKWINDHYGHNEGDRALMELAHILKKTFRDSDIIARIGGDEFVVLLELAEEKSPIFVNRLFEKIEGHNAMRSRPYSLSISAGMAQFDPAQPISIDELVSEADASMYAQKRKKSTNKMGPL